MQQRMILPGVRVRHRRNPARTGVVRALSDNPHVAKAIVEWDDGRRPTSIEIVNLVRIARPEDGATDPERLRAEYERQADRLIGLYCPSCGRSSTEPVLRAGGDPPADDTGDYLSDDRVTGRQQMTPTEELLEAIRGAAHRICGGYGPCYCRPPQPSPELGHERSCQRLRQAIRAFEARQQPVE